MKCIYCGDTESKVIDSRPNEEGTAIRRRRECMKCGKRFTTYEKIEDVPMMVVKKDGRREPFSSNKILFGVRKSCEKLPIAYSEIEKLVENVERELLNSLEQEITSDQIGELVLRHLRDLNQVAYVRFAAVYRSFQDVDSFLEELNNLRGEAE